MHEVNQYILGRLRDEGAKVNGYFTCPYVDQSYVEQKKGTYSIHTQYIKDNHPWLKPNPGMVEAAVKEVQCMNKSHELPEMIYVIGDRAVDIAMALTSGGKGILVPEHKTKELGDVDNVKKMIQQHSGRIFIATNFLAAATWIKRDIEKLRS